ncbi:threonine-rich protein-like isoform X2 [Acropora muricata]|uniref:threonine-rich protein-like isoform X2 n=1 Tax=Acropora muricata TaxID=159855 RepID=UPI0034E42899
MEFFYAMIFVCLALCILPQDRVRAHGDHPLECYVCGPGSPCGPANKDKRTCNPPMEDSCATFILDSVIEKNCTNALSCSLSGIGDPCAQINRSAPNCSFSCCLTDLCNVAAVSSSGPQPITSREAPATSTGPQSIISREAPGTGSSAPPKSQQPTSGVPQLTANFVTVIMTVMLAKFVKPLSMF